MDRRSPAEVAAADEFAEQVAEVERWAADDLKAIRESAARDDMTAADEDAVIERYRAYRAARRRAAEAAADADRRVAKWIMRHGEPRTHAARAELAAYLAKPVIKQQRREAAAREVTIAEEQRRFAEATAEALERRETARRQPAPARRATAPTAPEVADATPRKRRRRQRPGVASTFDPISGEVRRPITDND